MNIKMDPKFIIVWSKILFSTVVYAGLNQINTTSNLELNDTFKVNSQIIMIKSNLLTNFSCDSMGNNHKKSYNF